MNNLIINQPPTIAQGFMANQQLTMSSREIADLVESRHDSVKRSIDTLHEKRIIGVPQAVEYLDTLGRKAIEYLIGKRDSYVIVAQLSPEFTARLVDRWQELESGAIPKTLSGALRLAADQAEQIERLAIERDTAIATKAQIGSRREATAMATASAAKREAATLAQELGRGTQHATIIAVEKATGAKFGTQGFRPLQKWCKANDVTPEKVPCPRYGKAASWPASAWADCYDISLVDLFGEVA